MTASSGTMPARKQPGTFSLLARDVTLLLCGDFRRPSELRNFIMREDIQQKRNITQQKFRSK